ncbi:MAG: tRNA (adenosine(37)-N6)-dimethylallyltransferase MiaA [Alphaproteobacteria bacterium]|nr:tRNA (adenosine(37)-N6)-dimethylallyltransferase MiaA [Alphaproteobacteria bacterium]
MRALLIMGPTASGKSALALALAERLGGEIVNADSMQVYRDLRVLTARPTPEEEARAPHHLYGEIDAAVRYSVGDWTRRATALIADIAARGRVPIVAGGTGLYFMALTEGLAEIPAPSAEVRAEVAARRAANGDDALHPWLAEVDPVMAARLSARDAPRIVRALEVTLTSGASIATWQTDTRPALAPEAWRGFALMPPRAPLYGAIDARFGFMLENGALEESRTLGARGLDPMLPCMKAHGMPWLAAHLRGEMTLAAAADLGRRDTRRYAKRQFTWIGNQMPDWIRMADVSLEARMAHVLASK